MAYREPAEDEEAKLDAAEVDAFRKRMAGAADRQRLRVFAWTLGGLAAFLVMLGCFITTWNRRPPRPRDECHHAATFHDVDGVLTRQDILVCPDAGT
jgi:hypothetical protein